MEKADRYLKMIKESGLAHASSRKTPLITTSCIFLGYTKILNKKVGYSYKNIGNIGRKDQSYFLINEDEIGKSFSQAAKNRNFSSLIKKMQLVFNRNKLRLAKVKKEEDSFKTLKLLVNVYPEVVSEIGFYNSIMRYVKDNKKRAEKLGTLLSRVGRNKEVVATLIYRVIEPLLKKCSVRIGKATKFDGGLLRYMTLKELKRYLKEKKISAKKIIELSKRRKNYLYLIYKGKEYITVDKEVVGAIYKQFIDVRRKIDVLKGVTAYPGKVRGRVVKAFHEVKDIKDIKPGRILVINITRPPDTPFLNKFVAIVADEGGVLSHTSVVARELKIPCVISTKIATKVFEDGDQVEVNANKGIVRKL